MKADTSLIVHISFIAIGVGLGFGGEISSEMYWMPPLGFGILRAYVVAGAYPVRERMGEKGRKITNAWTAIAWICGVVYFGHLGYAKMVDMSTMWALQALNIMLVPTEAYFSLRQGEHPAETKSKALETQIETLESELNESRFDFERVSNTIESYESAIEKSSEQIKVHESRIEDLETASEVQFDELARVNGELSKFKKRVSIVQSVGKNMRACYCGECGEFNSWGIANKAPVCEKCKNKL